MAVKIRLKRMGKKKQPTYRVVVADSRSPRDGRIIERLGRYDPRQEPSLVEIDNERAQYWLSTGAQPTDRVRKLLEISGAVARAKVSRSGVYRLDDDPPPAPEREPAEKSAEQAERAMKPAEQPAPQAEQAEPTGQAEQSSQEPAPASESAEAEVEAEKGEEVPAGEAPQASETETGTQEEAPEEPEKPETPEDTETPDSQENKNPEEKAEPAT